MYGTGFGINKKDAPTGVSFFVGCGRKIRTSDLRVMSPTSYPCSTPRYRIYAYFLIVFAIICDTLCKARAQDIRALVSNIGVKIGVKVQAEYGLSIGRVMVNFKEVWGLKQYTYIR